MSQDRQDRDAGRDMGTDRRGLQVLDVDTCLARIATQPVGRVAMLDQGDVVIFPVNHVLDGMTVGFRTTTGTKLSHAVDGSQVSFEVDGADPETRSGWSVLVKGTAGMATDSEAERLQRLAPEPWTGGDLVWVVVRPREISGRELRQTGSVS